MEQEKIKVGIGVLVLKDGKVLLGKRKSAHGDGEYATPGGHLEYMESFIDCAKREVAEETGMKIKNIKFMYIANLREYAPKHYVHIEVIAEWESGEPQLLEPDKCESWDWYDLKNMPSPRFKTIDLAVESMDSGRNFFD